MRQFYSCENGVWNTSLHIVWCSKLSHYLGQYSSRLLIFHDQGFTGSKFHSSSLERLCFEQELAWNTIAPRIPELLWGKLRLITIICSGFLGSWGQTLGSHNVRFRYTFISPVKIDWYGHIANSSPVADAKKSLAHPLMKKEKHEQNVKIQCNDFR